MAQTFEYRGFKISTLPAVLAMETVRVVAKRGRKSFTGRLGDVTAEIDAYLASK